MKYPNEMKYSKHDLRETLALFAQPRLHPGLGEAWIGRSQGPMSANVYLQAL